MTLRISLLQFVISNFNVYILVKKKKKETILFINENILNYSVFLFKNKKKSILNLKKSHFNE